MKYLKPLYYLFGVVIGLIALLLIVSILPIPGNYEIFVVQSGSMEPAIKTGSIVVVRPSEDYQQNDVITYKGRAATDIPTTHRIVDIRLENGTALYSTKGDANNAADVRDIQARDIIGKVLFSVPFLGYGLAVAKEPIGFVILIIIPALLLIFDEGKKISGEIKKLRTKEP